MKNQILIITALNTELSRDRVPANLQLVYCGVGKINATLATVKAIHQFQPRVLINFGTAGKVNPDLHGLIGISRVVQRDMHTEPLAPRGVTPFCERPHEYQSALGRYACGSGDSFVTAHDPWLLERKIDVVDMELFAIAAVAHDYRLPWYSFKFITDSADDSSANEWGEKVSHGEQLFLDELAVLRQQL